MSLQHPQNKKKHNPHLQVVASYVMTTSCGNMPNTFDLIYSLLQNEMESCINLKRGSLP